VVPALNEIPGFSCPLAQKGRVFYVLPPIIHGADRWATKKEEKNWPMAGCSTGRPAFARYLGPLRRFRRTGLIDAFQRRPTRSRNIEEKGRGTSLRIAFGPGRKNFWEFVGNTPGYRKKMNNKPNTPSLDSRYSTPRFVSEKNTKTKHLSNGNTRGGEGGLRTAESACATIVRGRGNTCFPFSKGPLN